MVLASSTWPTSVSSRASTPRPSYSPRGRSAISRKSLGPDDPLIAVSLNNLARARQSLGKTVEARRDFDEAVTILRRLQPEGSPIFARILWRSASARLDNKDADAALPELEEAVAMAEKFLKPEHPYLTEYRETLAKCRAALAQVITSDCDDSVALGNDSRRLASETRQVLVRRCLYNSVLTVVQAVEDLLALDEFLSRFAALVPIKAELVMLRFLAGMTIPEAAHTCLEDPANA